ncbi:MAG: hypothetical protein ACE5JJ_07160 [Nitrospinota bacterium]
MMKEGRLTTTGVMFVIFLALALTTSINPLINHRYFNLWWYFLVALYGLWVLIRVVYAKEDAR